MNITHRIFLAVFVTVHVAAGAVESVFPKASLPHFEPKRVVFSYEGLRYRPHDDVIFPSVVATSGRFRNALGRYYLYYAPHDAPGGICLAYADHLEGPWKEYAKNPLISREWKPHYKVSHVSGPHAIWNEAEKNVFLYFHGENSHTRLATSRDGIHFDYDRTVITTAAFPGLSEASYARVFEHKLPDVDNRFIMLLMGNHQGTRRIYLAWSKDGRKWTPRAEPFMDPPPGNDQVAGAWLLPWKVRNYIIAHANPNLAQGAGGINGRGFDLYLNETDAAFTRAKPIGKFMEASAFGADNPALMSPCIFEENGALYLFVNIGARLNNTIALAVAKPGAPLAALHATKANPSVTKPEDIQGQSPSLRKSLRVADFGALGDGVHDDGPAIAVAFKAAKADGVPSTVGFEKKTYRLGDNPTAWHYFQMLGHEDLVIEGGGATLLCPEGNLAFYFEGGHDITVRGLTFDTIKPAFTQGEVVAMDGGGTLEVKIMQGYPEPPDEAFLTANGHQAHGGGGRHMIVFEKGGSARNTRMSNDHLYIRNITRVSPGVFLFHVKEDYIPRMKGVAVGNWVSYGFNKANLPAAVVAAKDKSASTYAQIAVNRVENITFEKLDFLGSLNGGIRVSDMDGDVTLREVRVLRKPGTLNLLSTPSDALHLMNIRGRLLIENCEVEAPGDDCLNVGTLMERIVEVSKDDPKAMTLTTTDNRYYYYTIRKGDPLQFLDKKTKREIGIATVEQVEFDPRRRSHRVVLDRELPKFDPATVLVLNLNQMTSATEIRNNVMRPFMRNAMLVRAQHMTIESNRLDGAQGGVIGLNFTTSMGESARLRNVSVSDNRIAGFQSAAIVVANAYRDRQGILDARVFAITSNVFQVGPAKSIRISGVQNLTLEGNRFEINGRAVERTADCVGISGCVDSRINY